MKNQAYYDHLKTNTDILYIYIYCIDTYVNVKGLLLNVFLSLELMEILISKLDQFVSFILNISWNVFRRKFPITCKIGCSPIYL